MDNSLKTFWEQSIQTWIRWIESDNDILKKLSKRKASLEKQIKKVNASIEYRNDKILGSQKNLRDAEIELQKINGNAN